MVDFYSYSSYKPKVKIENGFVIVENRYYFDYTRS
jgi:hypothetical protein